MLCANSPLFWLKIANEHSEFRNYLMYLHQSVHDYSIRNLCNGFYRSRILISLCQNGGSQNPDRESMGTEILTFLSCSRNSLLLSNISSINGYNSIHLVSKSFRIISIKLLSNTFIAAIPLIDLNENISCLFESP